jgi:hypothetical protein
MRAAQGEDDGGGGANRERRWTATAADGGGEWWRKGGENEGVRVTEGEGTEVVGGGAGARKTYDMWTPQFFLSPVDPTLRF